MPDNKRISELATTPTLDGTDLFEIAQVNAGSSSGYASLKTTLTAIANKIAKGIQFGDLQTTAKDLIDAINEAAISGGNSNIADDYDNTQTYAVGDYCIYEGDLYKCITAVTSAESFDSTKWTAVLVTDELGQSSGGGHEILDDSGIGLTQRDELQFVGTYSEDDSTNEITKVNIVREMTKAQYDLLSAAQKKGIIRTTDEPDGGGGGGGSSYSETVLWSGSETPTVSSPYTATLSDSIENYDAIAILCKNYQGDEYYNLPIFLTSEFIIDRHFEGSNLQYSPAYDLWRLSNTTISLGLYTSQSSVIYEKVIGIKFGGGSSVGGINYSLTEQNTGLKWIDGSDIYQKTISLGALPNNTLINYPHGISDIDKVVDFKGFGVNSSRDNLPLPYVNADNHSYQTQIEITSTDIIIKTYTNLSSYSGYATLYYTKSTS